MSLSIRSRPSKVMLSAVLVASALSACSIEDTMSLPDCERGESGLISAQSVPTAELVPCFTRLPAGWEPESIKIDQDGTRIRFDSDRAGGGAAVLWFRESCDLDDAVSEPSEHDGAARYDYIDRVEPGFRADRYHVFGGGCVWWEFDFDDGVPAGLSVEVGNSLVLLTRQSVNDNIRENFIDEEL